MTDLNFNPNYAATVVALKEFVDLPNCDNVKAALIFGNSVIVNKKYVAGEVGIFFPVETQLGEEFLANNNLYKHAEWGNVDPTKTGFFDKNGRVKAVRFRGHKSEGFWLPIDSVKFLNINPNDLDVGFTFVKIGNVEICRKYIPTEGSAQHQGTTYKAKSLKDRIVDGQFKFHYDTENLRRNIHKFQPTDYISISDKWHGTSAIFSKPLVVRSLPWYERLLRWVGVSIQETEHALIYSSRTTVKGINTFEGNNIWATVASEIADKIPASYTIYGEIVGYENTGKAIQKAAGGKPYAYGCAVGEHKFVVYRVKTTNIDGKTLELSWPQMKEFCSKYGLEMVKELFYGPITDLVPFNPMRLGPYTDEERLERWQKDVLAYLEKFYAYDQMCEVNNNEVPAEGVVVRRDGLTECDAWKLKNFRFLEDETKKNDKGVIDIETEESIQVSE